MAKLADEGNPYKIDNAERAEGDTLSFYVTGTRPGEDFEDLCRGPHVASTGVIGAFKLQRVSGSYYRGDAKLQSLQRVYGTAFFKKRSLTDYLKRLEEAKKRDHRKLGAEMDLFVIDENVGIGLPLWLPKGMIIREELEKLAKETEDRAGYQRVSTPHITKGKLYEMSGHLAHYKDSMFPPMNVDGEDYYLKPMNCPHHHMIFRARPRSYRELPLRLAEYGTCYRYEQHGELAGLLRVRCMSMNDAHIYCTMDQLKEEFKGVMDLHKYYYDLLGLTDYYLRLSLHDPANTEKYVGDPEMWTLAERMVQEAMTETGLPFKTVMGEAAFYGPKIDVQFKNVAGREESNATNQVDFVSAKRFDLTYVGADNRKHRPVILHRAPLGTHERFVAFLIEHYAGIFPLWLAPVQVGLVTISEKSLSYGRRVHRAMTDAGLRVEFDDSGEKVGPKKHRFRAKKIPYILVVGEREAADGTVNVNNVHGKMLGSFLLQKFQDGCLEEVRTRARRPFFEAE
ncbi:MAG: threonine--tRNA ligase, partial [Proteobacteria bacterium]|nr:threonine--tRNA ligase [Pseudomonadota bacterium]